VIAIFKSRQFFLFILTGGFAAGVNFVSRIIFNYWFDFSTSIILAYIMGMITAFTLSKIFVFKDGTQSLHNSVVFFILVNLVAILQTWVISMIMEYYLLPWLNVTSYTKEISHAFGVMFPVFTSYIGHKRWSFKSTLSDNY